MRVLTGIIKHSDYPKKSEIIGVLNKIQNESKRNIFSHSYVIENDNGQIQFLEKTQGGRYQAQIHTFTEDEFDAHVRAFIKNAKQLVPLLQLDESKIAAFALAALSATQSETTSPQPPKTKA